MAKDNIRDVTKIVLSVPDHAEYQKGVYEGSFGTSLEGILETIYGIEIAVDSKIPKGYMFVHERDQAAPSYITITQFRRTYGTI